MKEILKATLLAYLLFVAAIEDSKPFAKSEFMKRYFEDEYICD